MWPSSQRALHGCTLRLQDGRLRRAGLFPFFDDSGQTQALMLVTDSSPQIYLLDYVRGQFSRPLPWRKQLRLRRADLRDSTSGDSERLAELWHFDPWWELGEERYTGHPAVPALKSTNIPGYNKAISRVLFASDLSRVTWFGIGRGEEFQFKRFRPQLLEPARRLRGHMGHASRTAKPATGWVLRPWWSR